MIPNPTYDFTAQAEAFLHGKGTYHLLWLPAKTARAISHMQQGRQRLGWGSVRVSATIGRTRWRSSVFPSNGTYLLLLNAKVRKAENITEGCRVKVTLELLP